MSQPSNESRITNLEKEAMSLGARIEELASDNAEELKAIRQTIDANFTELKQDISKLDEGMRASFLQIGDAFNLNADTIEAVKKDISALKSAQDARFDKLEARQDRQEQLLQEILSRLPPKP